MPKSTIKAIRYKSHDPIVEHLALKENVYIQGD